MGIFDSAMEHVDQVVFNTYSVSVLIVDTGEVLDGIFELPVEESEVKRSNSRAFPLLIDLQMPWLCLNDAIASKVQKGAVLQIKGQLYHCGKPRPDGSGLTYWNLSPKQAGNNDGGNWRRAVPGS